MRFRWGVAALAAGAAFSLGMTQASARTSDAPPPLTPAQLIALRHVASWDVDFHTTYTGQGDGSATTGPYFQNGRNVTVDAVRSYSFSRSSEAHFTVTTNGSDCNLLDHIGCPVDLTHQASVSFDVEASTQGNFAFSDGCAQDDGTVGPAHIHESDVTSASGSAADSEIDPALLAGAFYVDYRTNPPSVFGSLAYGATVHNAERIENDNCFAPPSTWPGPSVNDVSVTAEMLDEVTIGEMKFAFVDGAFETSGTSTTTLDGCVQTGRCGGGAYTSSTETRTFTWNIREHLDNEPRIDSATFQQPDIPTGVMHAVPPTGTYDGNPVQLSLHLANPRPTAQDVQVVVTDTDTGLPAALTGTQTTTIAAGGTADLTLGWNTNGKAWKADHTPQPAHGFTVKLLSADSAHTWDTVNRDLIVLPKPVVLVHGWNSSAATWATLQSYLSTHYPYWRNFAVDTMNTGNLLSPLTPSNTVAQNAQALDAYVRSVRSQTEAQHVDLLVHSMGGLISRQYIQDDMPSDASDGLPV